MKKISLTQTRIGIVVAVAALVAQCLLPITTHAAAITQSVFVPGYSYPKRWPGGDNSYWEAVRGAGATKVPFVVVNPNSGPGVGINADYTGELADLDARGVKYIGYIKHNKQQRDIKEVAAEIDRWYQLYPGIKGVFFDETHNESNLVQACYIANLYNYMKVKYPGSIVVHNPGTRLRNESIVPYGDVFMVAETSASEYINNPYFDIGHPDAQPFEKDPANAPKIWHAVHDITSLAEQDQVLELAKQRNAGWVYFTSDSLTAGDGNPYNNLSVYFTEFVNKASVMPPTVLRIGTRVPLPAGCNDVFNLNIIPQSPPAIVPSSSATPVNPVVQVGSAVGDDAARVAEQSGRIGAPNTGYQRQIIWHTTMFAVMGVVLVVVGCLMCRTRVIKRH